MNKTETLERLLKGEKSMGQQKVETNNKIAC